MRKTTTTADYTFRLRVYHGRVTHAARPYKGWDATHTIACCVGWGFHRTKNLGTTWLPDAEPVTCKGCIKALAKLPSA